MPLLMTFALKVNMLSSGTLLPAGPLLDLLVVEVLDAVLGPVQDTAQVGPFRVEAVADKSHDLLSFFGAYRATLIFGPFLVVVPPLPTLLRRARAVLKGDFGPRQGDFGMCTVGVAWRLARRVLESLSPSDLYFLLGDDVSEFDFLVRGPVPVPCGFLAVSRHDGKLLLRSVDVRLGSVKLKLKLKLVMMLTVGTVGWWMVHDTTDQDPLRRGNLNGIVVWCVRGKRDL